MPDNHKLYTDQPPQNAIAWAKDIGRSTLQVVELILKNAAVERQGVQSLFTLKKVLRKHTKYELEKACQTVLDVTNRPTVSLVKTALKNNQKQIKEEQMKKAVDKLTQNHGFTRGANYYGGRLNDE